MRKIVIICLSVIGLINCLQGQQFSITARINAEAGITISSATSTLNSNSTLSSFSINSIRLAYPNTSNTILNKFLTFKGSGNADTFIKRVNSLGIFSSVEKDIFYSKSICNNSIASQANDPLISNGTVNNYALNLIEAPCAWSVTRGDARVRIGIADDDFQTGHQDLTAKVATITGPVTGMGTHGTHVSGVAACHTNNGIGISAIGYNSRLALRRIIHSGNGAWASDIRDAIWDLFTNNIRIINVSWTGTGLSQAAAQQIVNGGTTLVLAAGNSVGATDHSNIANIPGVINVSGVNHENKAAPTNHARNQWVDLCAPSVNVASTAPNNSYSGAGGTSFAAPQVAGTVGLIRALNPCLTPPQIETIIRNTTDPIADGASYTGLLGTGRLNSYRAVLAVVNSPLSITFQQNRPNAGTGKYPTGTTTIWGNGAGGGFTKILAGKNVTTGTQGDVIIPQGSIVKYDASYEVELGAGFEDRSGNFEIRQRDAPCAF